MSTKHHPSALHKGTNAERVAYATHSLVPGMMWVETDTQDIYVWDGTAWDGALGAGGGAPHNLLSATHPDTNVAAVVQADIVIGDATPEWARLAKGNVADVLRINAAGVDVAWEALFDAVVPNTIQADDAAFAGVAVVAAMRDHEHGFPCGIPVDTGVANAEGILYDFVRSDHVHKLHDHLHAGVAGDGGDMPAYFLTDGSRTLTGDLDLGAGVDIIPTASGQNLGDATHRLDLFTNYIDVCGPDGENAIFLTDNLADALHVVDWGDGNEYLTFVTTNAQREVVFNEQGADIDFRVEGDTVPNLFLVDASADKVGIAEPNPLAKLHVGGDVIFDTDTGNDPFWITRSGATNQAGKLYVDDAYLRFESIQDEAAGNFASMLFRCGSQVGQAPVFRISDYRSGADVNRFYMYLATGRTGINCVPSYMLDVFEDRANYIARFWNDGNNDNRQGILIYCGLDANPAAKFLSFRDGNGDAIGHVIGDGAGGVTYFSASDERLKSVLGTVDQDLAMRALTEVNPIRYVGKGLTETTGRHNIGFLAQDIHRYFPEIASYDEEIDLYGIEYGKLTPVLWVQNQVLLARIEKLEAKVGR